MTAPVQARSIATLEKIYAATEALIARRGVGSLTMEAVAAEAGISKGGVLHHFRSKEALVTGLLKRKIEAMHEGLAKAMETIADPQDRTLGGMVKFGDTQYRCEGGFPRALLVAAVENSQSLELFRETFGNTLANVRAESRHPARSTALLFAVMGMLLTKSLGFAQLEESEAAAMFDALQELVGGA